MAGINFVESIAGTQAETIASAALVAVGLVATGIYAARSLRKKERPIVPDESFSLVNFFELSTEFVVKLADSVMGKENRKYIPFVATVFIYVFGMNVLGLIPGFSMPSDSFAHNFGLAIVVFILYNTWGIKEVGLKHYLAHLCGPGSGMIWFFTLGWFLFIVELISHVVRPVSLSIRLYANMTADHAILDAFTGLWPHVVIPVLFYFLGIFVCFMQAFVFSLLTMIYIKLAVTHEEGHEQKH